MNIDWKAKLSSRKFWALLAALASCVLSLWHFDTETIHEVTAMITATGACIVYMLAESHADANRSNKTEETNEKD